MEIAPKLTATRFAPLDPGDLFICHDGTGSYVAITVTDPTSDGDKLALLLCPPSAQGIGLPTLTGLPPDTLAISFGKNYLLRLPCDTTGWLTAEPSRDRHCLVLQDEKLYIRGFFPKYGVGLLPCYVGIKDGLILTAGSGPRSEFTRPRGNCAYATEWVFLTMEKEPRVILSFPQSKVA